MVRRKNQREYFKYSRCFFTVWDKLSLPFKHQPYCLFPLEIKEGVLKSVSMLWEWKEL